MRLFGFRFPAVLPLEFSLESRNVSVRAGVQLLCTSSSILAWTLWEGEKLSEINQAVRML
jgi:hypothetical protein